MDGGFLQPEQPELENSTPTPSPEPVQIVPRNQEVPAPLSPAEAGAEDEYAAEERKATREMAEKAAEGEPSIFEQAKEEAPTTQVQTSTAQTQAQVAPSVPTREKDEVDIEVGKILEDGLVEYFQTLPPEAQARFKKKGEEIGEKIAVMVRDYKVQVKAVLLLIRDWLLTIPGVNKFFLEQEAKIKTDRILEYEEEFHKSKQNLV
jgi:hypothetical protein